MTSPSSEFASLIRNGDNRARLRAAIEGTAREYNLYCSVCRDNRTHTVRRWAGWTTLTCARCGKAEDWRTEQVGR